MNAYNDVRSPGHKYAGVERAVIFKRQPGQVTELIAAANGGPALAPRLHGAANGSRDHGAFSRRRASNVSLRNSVVISWHFHQLIYVIRRRGLVLREMKTQVLYHRLRACANRCASDP